jgi:hypothetical protein
LPRKQRLVRCPVCHKEGRVKRNTIAIRFCYPEKTVSVPNISKFDTTRDAWDYAAKVCLRMSQRVLKDPHADAKTDSEMAAAFYEHFRTLIPHSDADIRNFESIHSQRIIERLRNMHNKIDYVENKVSKMALSLLYGAIVCTVMSDLLSEIPANSQDVKIRRKSAYAIYTHYSQLLVDERAKTTWLGWFCIVTDSITELSPKAAVKRYAKGIRGGSLSRKQVKGKERHVIKKLLDSQKYDPIFLKLVEDTGLLIRRNKEALADILSRFEKFQFEVYHQKREYQYAYVIHNKSSSYSPKDNQYFKEGKKRSLYSKKNKGIVHEIFPSESLTEVTAEYNNKDDNTKDSNIA